MEINTVRKILPLFLIELYLLFTIGLIFFGPVIWPIENTSLFISYLGAYHLAFIAGYLMAVKRYSATGDWSWLENNLYKPKFFYLILSLAILPSIALYYYIVRPADFTLNNVFFFFMRGITNSRDALTYYHSEEYAKSQPGNVIFSLFILFLSVFKFTLLPYLFHFWDKLSIEKKILGFGVSLIPLVAGVSISLSAINFSYLFVIGVCFIFTLLKDKNFSCLKERKFFLFFLVFIFVFSFWTFYNSKSAVSAKDVVSGKSAPARFEFTKKYNIQFKRSPEESGLIKDFSEKMTIYLVNGYIGMSKAIGEKFETSYGVGHSIYLQKNFDKYLGVKTIDRSFQSKISHKWNMNEMWHSAYTYFANDISFIGVIFLNFFIGYLMANVYLVALHEKSVIAFFMLPLFAIMVLYIPANNQVFSFVEYMSSFWVLLVFFFYFKFKKSDFLK